MDQSPPSLVALFAVVAPLLLAIPAAAVDADRGRAEYWIGRCPSAGAVLLDAAGVAALNRRLLTTDRSVRDLASLPEEFSAEDVRGIVTSLATLPDTPLVHAGADPVSAADRERWLAALDRDAIPARVAPRFALVTRRTALRRFPSAERIHRAGRSADIDLFQEAAFFPGTPVAAVHATRAGDWTFVLGTTYAAWIETTALAFAPRGAVLDFARRSTHIVTEPRATAFPAAGNAGVVLDMGTALPAGREHPGTLDLPVRDAAGGLAFASARIEPAAAAHDGPLPASRRTLLLQAFRFLGEPYGWGHSGGTRDCSGFVGDVYRSLGILLPRNTGDQAASPAFARTVVDPAWSRDRRLAEVSRLLPGDLVFVPGHVMMIVGHDGAGPWVIHDTHEGRVAGDPQPVNGVVVAPLERMLSEGGTRMVDRVTTLVRILPAPPAGP